MQGTHSEYAGLPSLPGALPIVVLGTALAAIGLSAFVAVRGTGWVRGIAVGEIALAGLMLLMTLDAGSAVVTIGSSSVMAAGLVGLLASGARPHLHGLVVLTACAAAMTVLAAYNPADGPMEGMSSMSAANPAARVLALVFAVLAVFAVRSAGQTRVLAGDLTSRCVPWCRVAMYAGMGAMCLSMA